MKPIPDLDGSRRLNPRIWDYNWYQLRLIRRAIERVLSIAVKPNKTTVALDLGGGERPYEPLLSERGVRYVGVDLVGNPRADVTFAPGEQVPMKDGCADIVLSSQVLEHVLDVEAYLLECRRLLKPGGLLLLSTHGFWVYHPYPVDVRRWTCWGLKYELEKHGFHVEEQVGCMGPLAYTTQLRLQLIRGVLWQVGRGMIPLIGLLSICAQVCMMLEDWITPRKVRRENSAVYVVAARKTADSSITP